MVEHPDIDATQDVQRHMLPNPYIREMRSRSETLDVTMTLPAFKHWPGKHTVGYELVRVDQRRPPQGSLTGCSWHRVEDLEGDFYAWAKRPRQGIQIRRTFIATLTKDGMHIDRFPS